MGRLVLAYLMFGTFQRKVLFDENATCGQREFQLVRTVTGDLRGQEGRALCPLLQGLRSVSQPLLEILCHSNSIRAEWPSASTCPPAPWLICSPVPGTPSPWPIAGPSPASLPIPLPHFGHTCHYLLVVSAPLEGQLWAPASPSSLDACQPLGGGLAAQAWSGFEPATSLRPGLCICKRVSCYLLCVYCGD